MLVSAVLVAAMAFGAAGDGRGADLQDVGKRGREALALRVEKIADPSSGMLI
jgi:hypothetical protein